MTGLRGYERDLSLAVRLGDADLAAPGPDEVVRLARERLGLDDVVASECVHARWKPGVSLTTTHAVRDASGADRQVVVRSFVEGKRAIRAKTATGAEHGLVVSDDGRLLVHLAERDRVLDGLELVGDARRLARLVEEAELVAPRSVRRRRTRTTLLRYKPERRAVLRLDLALREGDAKDARFGLRVLPRDAARANAVRRREVEPALDGLGPTLLAHEERFGVLLETWLDGLVTRPHDAFDHALEAGRHLARLHASPCTTDAEAPAPRPGLAPDSPLQRAPALAARAGEVLGLRPVGSGTGWVHGDHHADQWARDAHGEPRLLDWDALDVGSPADDAASWVADHLEADADVAIGPAAEPLLVGLAEGGAPLDARGLERRVARALVGRAENALRRLERGAVDRATALVGRACALVAGGASS